MTVRGEAIAPACQPALRITEEEEENFDKQHSDYVDRYINLNYNRVNSYPTVDINRLYTGNHHTRAITIDEK